jgi:tetratricopeptide (TPR) repeat protein
LQELGRFDAALRDFERLAASTGNPHFFAAIAYCIGKIGFPTPAAAFCQKALDRDLRSPEILNNIGVAYTELGQLDKALQRLDEAVALNPTNLTLYRNRAKVKLKIALRPGGLVRDDAIADIHKVLRTETKSSTFYELASTLCVLAAKQDPQLHEEAISYLCAAIELGKAPEKLQKNHHLRPLLVDARVIAVTSRFSGEIVPPVEQTLLDPLPAGIISLSTK